MAVQQTLRHHLTPHSRELPSHACLYSPYFRVTPPEENVWLQAVESIFLCLMNKSVNMQLHSLTGAIRSHLCVQTTYHKCCTLLVTAKPHSSITQRAAASRNKQSVQLSPWHMCCTLERSEIPDVLYGRARLLCSPLRGERGAEGAK